MRRLLSFGTYVFPDTQMEYSDNFTNIVQRTSRLPGLSGGYDELGMGAGASEVGNVRVGYWLLSAHRGEITQKRDEINALAHLGIRKLVYQPADQSELPRYCYARVTNIQMSENAGKIDLHQKVQMNFQVAYPRWLRDVGNVFVWGEGSWGSGVAWGGAYPTTAVSSAGAVELSVSNAGNAAALARVLYQAETESTGLVVQRIVDGAAVDEVALDQTIAVNSLVNIDARRLAVTVDAVDAYGNFTYNHPAWVRLMPGDNTLRFTLSSGNGSARVVYDHTWY